ncbi:tRNA-uridine aminocarboxypropyltransferase [Undibacterium fentianense]|uniref:tRNA-uridine aminocarboxypropyltransferase n=1 Tax=Undibacterium fentianense TaxID=2828728 RepID=UPI001E3F2948|nr:tRNA-uridine aminocarboxypropyltransferase [Undibacterium fentianense]
MSSRSICPACLRALKACICVCVKQVATLTEVLIVQHPAESKHIKGSARLLHLCLPNSRLWVSPQGESGGSTAHEELTQILQVDDKQNVLLYPETDRQGLVALEHASPTLGQPLRLIVIDASWRHSLQILRQYPLLQALPRFALRQPPTSRYTIRHAHAEHQLSTMEAVTYALAELEPKHDPQNTSSLLSAFEAFNQLQLEFGVHRLQRPAHASK